MDGSAPILFDRRLARRRLARAVARGYAGFLLGRAADDLLDRLGAVTRRFPLALDLASPTAEASRALGASGQVDRVLRLSPVAGSFGVPTAVGDEEALPIRDGSLDLVVSLLALQGLNDLPGALLQARRALKPDGLFLACLLGGDSLAELRAAFAGAETELRGGLSPRVAPFADLRTLGSLLQRAGFALPVVDLDTVTVRYPDPFALFADLRAMGWTNALAERSRTPLSRALLGRVAAIYAERFADRDGRVRATFDLAWLSGWAPHESQPKPLKPGSATARLADALGAREFGAADFPSLERSDAP